MNTAELLKKVRKIEIVTNRVVNEVFAGEYQSVFKGRGMEFSEVREYAAGDDVRTIDWNVTARMGHPFVKKYVEERELTVMLLVDGSGSGAFGTVRQMKRELAAELCAVLAVSAIKNNDRVGFLGFTDRVERFIPPKKGRNRVLRVIREALSFEPMHRRTDIAVAIEYLNRVVRRRSVAFLISDYLASGYEKPLSIVGKKHDVIPIVISDPREMQLPPVGFLRLRDAETDTEVLVDTGDRDLLDALARMCRHRTEERERFFRANGFDYIDISTEGSYVLPLVAFFRARARRLGR